MPHNWLIDYLQEERKENPKIDISSYIANKLYVKSTWISKSTVILHTNDSYSRFYLEENILYRLNF